MTAQTADGSASFRRTGDGTFELDIEYRVEDATAELPEGDLQAGFVALCEREIGTMRRTLAELGDAVADQLRDDGRDAVIRRGWADEWSRAWRDDRTAFTIRGATSHTREALTGYEGVSAAGLVLGTVSLMIEQRERNIRAMYGKILADVEAKRGENTV